MEAKILQLTLTPFEASQVMALKQLLNRHGDRLSTSQVIATAVRIALDTERKTSR